MKKLNLELNLFDGEASTDGAPSEMAAPAADAQPQNADMPTLEDQRNAEFEKLIKGEYKEQFDKRIKENLKRRFKESSSLKAKVSQNNEIIDMLKIKYGISGDNMDEIANAIKNDDGYLKAEAEKTGIEPETLRRIKELEFENESMKRQIEDGLRQSQMQSTVNSWINDSKELIESYPDFDLEKECQNPLFAKMLRAGIDLKSAYYATHHKDIIDMVTKKASQEASLKITDSIRARGIRPNENGMSGQSTAIIKTDVSKLTPKERAEIAKRVMSGEEISF